MKHDIPGEFIHRLTILLETSDIGSVREIFESMIENEKPLLLITCHCQNGSITTLDNTRPMNRLLIILSRIELEAA